MISIVIPTISGREKSLERTISAYEQTTTVPYQLVVVENERNWPTACNEGFQETTMDVVHFGADDLEPLPRWHDEVLRKLKGVDELPAARVMNFSADGEFDNAGDGPDGGLVWFTRVPIMRRDQYERIGPWPEIDYYADVWLSEQGRKIGIETRMFYSYAFVHHWHETGRLDSDDNLRKSWEEFEQVR